MENISTLLFDIDGTVLDTGEFIIQATEHALATLGYVVPERSIIKQTVGIPFPQYYEILSGSKDKEKTDALIETHRDFQYKNYHLVRPFSGAVEVLNTLKNKGYKLAAVTTRSKKTSHQTLVDAGVFDLFHTIISFEDAAAHKPDPAPLMKALEDLGETPNTAMMIGDSNLDILAGKNAGTKTVRVKYGFHTDKLHEPEPDYFIEDIRELLKLL